MIKRRDFLKGTAASVAALSGTAAIGKKSAWGQALGARGTAASRTLRIIHGSNLQSRDPIWTTAPPTKDYAFLVFDQLLSVDEKYVPRPQMAEGWTSEDNDLTFVFKLREGLTFHDGEPVRSQDCIPSIKRWGARDGFGQAMMKAVDTMDVVDDRTFKIKLKQSFPLLPHAIGKSSSSQCFIMPERMALTDPMKQVTETIGSGPYRFIENEFVSGSHAAWARFEKYVPRKEPVSGIAGGRIPAVDRLEWAIISDPATAMSALLAGEKDYWDSPTNDLIPVLAADQNIVVSQRNTSGSYSMLQFNHVQPPFNNVAMRQALAMAIDQEQFLKAVSSDPSLIKPCYGFYACDTAYASEDGADVLKVKNLVKAKEAMNAAGYNGEKIVILGLDSGSSAPMAQVLDALLRKLGMNVQLVAVDFATLAQRRVSREPTDKGGWSLFVTGWTGTDILDPAVNQLLRGGGAKGWFGWADDPALEDLRDRWFASADPDDRAKLANEIQLQAFKTLPYVPLGSTSNRVAYRKNLTGVFPAPVAAYWNIGKQA